MPVARIVTHNVSRESPALTRLIEQLRASGYEVDLAEPGAAGVADVVVELQEVPLHDALDAAAQVSRESNADVFIAPGIFAASPPAPQVETEHVVQPPARNQSGDSPLLPHSERIKLPPAEDAATDVHFTTERGSVIGTTLEELGAAMADGRVGVRDTVSGLRARVAETWAELRQRRAKAAHERRLERERRDIEREQQRQEHELELQRRAEERQQLLAERERAAAEQERLVREQMMRDAAARTEHERIEREAIAREAARRAEVERAQEQERLRLAAVEAERLRALRRQETETAALAAAPTLPAKLEAITRIPVAEPLPVAPRPRLVPARRMPTSRERQWQRAAFIASIATLAAMLGYAIAGSVSPSSPLPSSIMQNSAEQKVPFGPAKLDASSGARSHKVATPSSGPGLARQGAVVPNQASRSASQKPSPSKPASRYRARRRSSENDVAEDEVVIRHAPARNQRAQTQRGPTTAGVRRYSDEN